MCLVGKMIDVNLWVSGNISVQGHKVLFFFVDIVVKHKKHETAKV